MTVFSFSYPFIFITLLQFIEVCIHLYMHSSPKVLHCNQRYGLQLGHCSTLILFFFGNSGVDLLLCFGSLSCCMIQFQSILSVRWMGSHLTEECFDIQRLYGISDGGYKEAQSHHHFTTVLYNWYEPFLLICCVWFLPVMMLIIIAKHLLFGVACPKDIVPKVLRFVQIFFFFFLILPCSF